jgi:LPXTG-motif cell wall-anchored protein
VTRRPTPLIRTAAVLATLVVAFATSSTAGAAPPCSKAILDDWLDNSRIDRIYDLPCYEAAIDAIPSDLLDYTDAADVIARAFQNVSGKRLERQLEGPSRIESPPPGVVPPVDSSASTAFPLPLLVLGGMSMVLLAAGGAGYVSRRRRKD